jgi:NAD+ kinase
MLSLARIGVYRRDADPADRLRHLRRLFDRAKIEVCDANVDDTEGFDLILALGGDGTVLRALLEYPATPVLAVNFGTVGFLTASDRDEMDKVVVRLLSDDYFIEERLTLTITRRGESHRCVNEVVIKGTTRMVSVGLRINDRDVHSIRGDGVIVGTPTGSTGYLMSAGAPIVTPEVDCIIVNPLNEYSFSSRAVVVSGSSRVDLDIEEAHEGTDTMMVIDGRDPIPVVQGERITVERSAEPARLVFFDGDYFFRNLKGRLRW